MFLAYCVRVGVCDFIEKEFLKMNVPIVVHEIHITIVFDFLLSQRYCFKRRTKYDCGFLFQNDECVKLDYDIVIKVCF